MCLLESFCYRPIASLETNVGLGRKALRVGGEKLYQARLAQSVERQALNLVVGGSSPPVGDSFCLLLPHESQSPNMQPF